MYLCTQPLGFSNQIKLYAFMCIYSKIRNTRLSIYDKLNCISPNFKFFKYLYQSQQNISFLSKKPDISIQDTFEYSQCWIAYSPEKYMGLTPHIIPEHIKTAINTALMHKINYPMVVFAQIPSSEKDNIPCTKIIENLDTYVTYMYLFDFRSQIRSCLQYTDTVKIKIDELRLLFPEKFDIGIHIRAGDKITSGEMGIIHINKYIDAVHEYLRLHSDIVVYPPTIYVMADGGKSLNAFKAVADTSWKIYSSTPDKCKEHNQEAFNDMSVENKLDELHRFLLDIEIMKRVPAIICTLSSNIGGLIYLSHTLEHPYIKSVDIPFFYESSP